MKKVIKKKLEETKQHAFEKKVLQREKAKGAPRVGEFYKENDILLDGQLRDKIKALKDKPDIPAPKNRQAALFHRKNILAVDEHFARCGCIQRPDHI